MTKRATDKESFEQQFKELEKLVEELESGEVQLDEGLEKFKRGLALAQALKTKLTEVENKVEIIKKKFSQALPDDETDTRNAAIPF